MSSYTTGQVARAAGVNHETLRFYEREGILPAPRRTRAGYRQYSDETVRVVTFIKRAQRLGFTLKEATALLALRKAGPKRREAARALAAAKIADIDQRIRDLVAIRDALATLVETCTHRAEASASCPILEALESSAAETAEVP